MSVLRTVNQVIDAVRGDLDRWDCRSPWFRGESGIDDTLKPRLFQHNYDENFLLQTFRRQTGGLIHNPPVREHIDQWLFLAQHYGVPTRLLDWTEGALLGLYFAINASKTNPRLYMLNPHALNELAIGKTSDGINFPLSWNIDGEHNIRFAWEQKNPTLGYKLPIALPATFYDHRMLSQRSCFTVHGIIESGLMEAIQHEKEDIQDVLIEYQIDEQYTIPICKELNWLGITQTTIFPDLDNLGRELARNKI
jgi:hypothetical protein